MKTAYFILGMHRSGTSALASTIDSMGITLGESLLPASIDNPKGYFENEAVQAFNESFLVQRGHGWDDVFFDLADVDEADFKRLVNSAARIIEKEFGVFDSFAIKDPRLCLLLPIWLEACRQHNIEPRVILAHRHPLEIALSLKKRNGTSLSNALALWAEHMFKAELYSRGLERTLVSYHQLLTDFESVSDSLASFMGLNGRQDISMESVIDPSLRHHKMQTNNLTDAPRCILELLEQYESGALSKKALNSAHQNFNSLKGFFFNAGRTSLFQQVFEERHKYKELKDDYFDKLQSTKKRYREALDELDRQRQEKKDHIAAIQYRDDRVRSEVEKKKLFEKEVSRLTHELQKTEIDLKTAQRDAAMSKQNETELVNVNRALVDDIKKLDNVVQQSQSEVAQLQSQLKAATQNIDEKEKDLNKLKQELDKGKQELDKGKQKIEEHRATIEGVTSRFNDWIDLVISPISSTISELDNNASNSSVKGKIKTLMLSKRLKAAASKFNKNYSTAKQLPGTFLANFDELGYLASNEDVEVAIQNGEFKNALEHFLQFGFQETMQGQRKIHPRGALFNPDGMKSDKKTNAFISFLASFYQEIADRSAKLSASSKHKKTSADVGGKASSFTLSGPKQLPQSFPNIKRRPAPNHISGLTHTPSVDIILPVYNALDDVKACIQSLYSNQTIPFNLIVIDDCSEKDTEQWLQVAQKSYGFQLSRNSENLRFTKTVNKGFSQSKGDFVVLLNSDTIVTAYWIEKILCCFSSDNTTGIVGPLSNAASWQTVPNREDKINGGWLVNEIPQGFSIELMGQLVETLSQQQYPSVPSVNGFCYAIRRDVIDKIGVLDEEYFPTGYGEEDDFSIRARKAGFTIRVADDTYIFHAKSKSYTKEVRKVLTVGGRKSLDKKHGKEEIEQLISAWKAEPYLPSIGSTLESYMHISSGNKKVVYTAIFGNYDNLKTPEYINSDWDYVCFTDNENVQSDVFIVKHVTPIFENVTKNARMVKLLSHLFLIGYEQSLWIDGSVKLRGKNIDLLVKENLASNYISLHKHVKRSCVYDEADACMMAKKDGTEILAKQVETYRNEGLPDVTRVFETAEIARNQKSAEVEMLNSFWWQQLDAFSIRDQVALPYVFWKYGFETHLMEGNQWLDPYFHMYKHKAIQDKPSIGVEIFVYLQNPQVNITELMSNIFTYTNYSNFEVSAIADKNLDVSDDEISKLESSYAGKFSFVNSKKQLRPSSLNTYIGNSKKDLCCILTDDIMLFNSDWLDKLVESLGKDTSAAIAGPTILSENFDFIASSVRIKRKQGRVSEIFNARKLGGSGSVLALHQSCILIDKQQFNNLAGFNKTFDMMRSAIVEFCHRNNTADKNTLLAANSEVMVKNDNEVVELDLLSKYL